MTNTKSRITKIAELSGCNPCKTERNPGELRWAGANGEEYKLTDLVLRALEAALNINRDYPVDE